MSEVVETIQGKRLDTRYTLLDKLGAGGQAEVWRAHDSIRGIDVALKVLNPTLTRNEAAWDALEHEYNICSRLNHPGILKVFPPERSGDAIILPMELAAGGDLRGLRGAGFLEIIPVLLEIAQALEHAHERGVVHRDLKPGNVLFDSRARVRLADFGVAGTASVAQEAKGAAQDGSRETPKHGLSPFTASPAQLRGEPPTPGDDIYGLGALAYELLSGYPPYYPNFNRKRALEEPVPELVPTRQIPPSLSALVTRMLAKDPRERPRSMREVIDELDAALNETLIFDFEQDSEPIRPLPPSHQPAQGASAAPPSSGSASVSGRYASVSSAAPLRTMFISDIPAANMPEGPPRQPEWSSGRERRATTDRRTAPRSPAASEGTARSSLSNAAAGSQIKPPERATTNTALSAPASSSVRAPVSPSARGTTTAPKDATSKPPVNPAASAGITRAPEARVPAAIEGSPKPHPFLRNGLAPRTASMSAGPAVHPTWGEIPLDGLPRVARLEPIPARRWPWIVLGLLAGAAAAVYFWLPHFDPQSLPGELNALVAPLRSAISPQETEAPAGAPQASSPDSLHGAPSAPPAATSAQTQTPPQTQMQAPAQTPVQPRAQTPSQPPAQTADSPRAAKDIAPKATSPAIEERLRIMRQTFDTRLAMLEARGAGVWGGRDFAIAKTRVAELTGAHDAGNSQLALERLSAAARFLDSVEAKAPQALSAQIAAGEKALGTGQQEVAGQAFDLPRRIDAGDHRAADGQRRAGNLNGILPLLADAQNAENAHEYARAAQDYSQALSLDPGNATAKAGQIRANAAFGDDSYAKAVGSGFAALGAGRLDEARTAFVKAKALKPNGSEAAEGLRRVSAALTARGFASVRARAAGLEGQERWDEAEQAYESVLAADSSLAFAQAGRARSASRAELSQRLQQWIDRPERLSAPGAKAEVRSLLETAQAQSPAGPVFRSQIARLQILLVASDKPVRLSLLSDNSTQVAISSIGSFGAFSRREIELRPGRYTVVGTRSGFRDVRREITIAPGQEVQTIKVTCSEPI